MASQSVLHTSRHQSFLIPHFKGVSSSVANDKSDSPKDFSLAEILSAVGGKSMERSMWIIKTHVCVAKSNSYHDSSDTWDNGLG